MKTVLLIAYNYPPLNSSGSRRLGCFAKYLPDYGWRPIVLTRCWTPDNCSYDPDFIQEIPEQAVVVDCPGEENGSGLLYTTLRKAHTFLCPMHTPRPWWRNAHRMLKGIFVEYNIDAIYASYDPGSALALGAQASRRWGVPWIADYRDVVDQSLNSWWGLRPSQRFHDKRLSRSASAIVTVSEGLAVHLRRRHKREVHIITNGFDPADFAHGTERVIPKFSISYTGSCCFPKTDPRPVLDALGLLVDSGQMLPEDTEVNFYGKGNDRWTSLLNGYKFAHLVKISGVVPRSEVVKIQQTSAVLLQLAFCDEKGIMTGKIFEYLAARRPILAVPNDHDCVDQLLQETNAGVSCSTVEQIARQLLLWYNKWKTSGTVACQSKDECVMKYSHKEHARRVAELLTQACEKEK